MTGPSWVVDGIRIATKIKSASLSCDPARVKWKSNPTKTCPRCKHVIDNSDVTQQWPGLPRGVKFDPSDQELLWHLVAKVGKLNMKPHPLIDEFIPTLEGDDGICYTHPRKLPGVKQDGSVSHFFHRTFKAYSTGTKKRRKIHNDGLGDVRWHKTGKTKPVVLDGTHQGSKKILVLYISMAKGGKPEKTNWVMHQYHLGTREDEEEGQYVVSKVFYQQQVKQIDKNEQEPILYNVISDGEDEVTVDPKSVTPEPPMEKRHHTCESERTVSTVTENCETAVVNDDIGERLDEHGHQSMEEPKWWEGESQFLLDSQQLAEGIALCDEFLRSQSSCGDAEAEPGKPHLSDYAQLGVESLKNDLEDCQKLNDLDHPDVYLGTPPDMRLSQLEFGSQDSFLAFGGTKIAD